MERIVTEEIREYAEGNPVEIVQTERDLVISRLESMNEAYNPQFSTRILKNMLKDAICVRLQGKRFNRFYILYKHIF